MAISLGGFSGGGGAGAVTSVNGQTGVVVVSGDDVAADHTASNYTAANANVDGHLSGIDTKLGTLAAGLTYKGAFNATAGTPSIANALQGDLYVVDTAGTIYGQTWAIGDHLLINANMGGVIDNAKIDKVDNTDQVTSVNGSTGAVTLSGDDLTADHTASNYTAANANIDGHLSGIDSKFGTLATVATSGAYSDLSGTPTLATVATSGAYSDLSGTPTLATVATSGAYSDLSGTPTLGTASAAATTDFLASTAGLNDLSDVSYTGSSGINNYVLTYNHSSTSWGAAVVPSAPVTSVNGSTGVVVVSGDDVAADHTASNYTAANANVDGHLSGIDTKLGTLATVATSGAYSDLSGTPTLATVATSGAYSDLSGTPTLATVATTGAYSDLSGTPTLGTASAAATTDFLSATGADTLGGNLDVGTSDIVSSSNNNIEFAADGTGVVKVIPTATGGHLELNGDGTNVGKLRLMCEQSSHGIYLTGPSHSASASYTLKFPDTAGTNNYVLKTDGSGNLDWVAQSGGGSAPNVTTHTISTNTTISTTTGIEEVHLINNSGHAVVITLPAASTSGAGYKYQIKRLGTANVTISAAIDAGSSFVLATQYDSLTVVSNGTQYYII